MGGVKVDVFLAVSFVFGRRRLATLLLFLYVTKEAGRKCVRDMPWPPAAECNMITNKQTNNSIFGAFLYSWFRVQVWFTRAQLYLHT